nr:hypothetical protein [uncultured Halomonas sp.]
MKTVGYAYLHQRLGLNVCAPARPAMVRPVTRIVQLDDGLAVPAERAPNDDLLAHTLFALKHEGIELAILTEALPHLPAAALVEALEASPNGIYLRKLGFLFEAFVAPLAYETRVGGHAVPLFDPENYVTGPAMRNSRWRVDFNGLGTLRYCATVRRTSVILSTRRRRSATNRTTCTTAYQGR